MSPAPPPTSANANKRRLVAIPRGQFVRRPRGRSSVILLTVLENFNCWIRCADASVAVVVGGEAIGSVVGGTTLSSVAAIAVTILSSSRWRASAESWPIGCAAAQTWTSLRNTNCSHGHGARTIGKSVSPPDADRSPKNVSSRVAVFEAR